MSQSEIISFEEHGEVLAHWHGLGWSQETVVVFDRHLDLKRIRRRQLARVQEMARNGPLDHLNRDLPFRDDERFPYGLDNFLYAAADLGLIRRVVWVVPEERPIDRKGLAAALWGILSLLPGHGREVAAMFQSDEVSAKTFVGRLAVEITTLRRLAGMDVAGARLDLDLDYFYGGGDLPVEGVAKVAAAASSLGLLDEPPTMTYSISSGFMPEAFRPLGAELSRMMGFGFAPSSPRPQRARRALELLASGAPITDATLAVLTDEDLAPLGGPGMALRAILCARSGRVAEAEDSYACARSLGDRATWAAYEMGLKLLTCKQYGDAAAWLARTDGEVIDTIEGHALALRALAECKRGNFEACLELAARCIEELPLRRQPYQLAQIAAARLDRRSEVDHARERLAWLEDTYEKAVLW